MGNYSTEKNVQMLISLMKQHGVRKIVTSPGMKNMPIMASVQFDPFFEVYSCVDERSAAYMACGMSVASGEPVALSCTGATASRNYLSALTEAYYRNIPILAITSISHQGEIGHLIPQMIDRRHALVDTVKCSVQIEPVYTDKDEWDVNTKINTALLELYRDNGGPVHINLVCNNLIGFTNELPKARKICRYQYGDKFPKITEKKVAIFVGTHRPFDEELTKLIDSFCAKYNGAVLCDNTSNYYGKYRICPVGLDCQVQVRSDLFKPDLLIHIGDVSGAYLNFVPKSVWRVNPDGEIRDTFKTLSNVFEMEEKFFFDSYLKSDFFCTNTSECNYYNQWNMACNELEIESVDIPFSNAWLASVLESHLPDNSILFLAILNSLRCWNFYSINNKIPCFSNTGGFGIDGMLSTAIGSAITKPDKIHYLIIGDLSFFYDLNSLGNRYLPNNLRIILVNNGRGIEFRNYGHPSAQFGEDADLYMAAAGHFGKQSKELVKHYALDLGLEYYSAENKDEFLCLKDMILSNKLREKSMIIEVFATTENESKALEVLSNIKKDHSAKGVVKNLLGESGVKLARKLIRR